MKYVKVGAFSGGRRIHMYTEQTHRLSKDKRQWIRVHWEMKKKLAGRQAQVLQGQPRYLKDCFSYVFHSSQLLFL